MACIIVQRHRLIRTVCGREGSTVLSTPAIAVSVNLYARPPVPSARTEIDHYKLVDVSANCLCASVISAFRFQRQSLCCCLRSYSRRTADGSAGATGRRRGRRASGSQWGPVRVSGGQRAAATRRSSSQPVDVLTA